MLINMEKNVEGKNKFVLYFSQAHGAADRAALLAHVKAQALPTDEGLSLRGATLADAIAKDRAAGNIPFYVCAYKSKLWLN